MKHMRRKQSGATIIEFSLALIIFLMFLLGILDFSRMLFTWNAANEASRAGARYAVVCDATTNKADVLARMQAMLPQIADIDLAWTPAGCTTATCTGVNLTITSLDYQWISPLAGLAKPAAQAMPTFSTFLPREIMRQDPHSNTLCS
jgi:Flp pilus assembly protein TadG